MRWSIVLEAYLAALLILVTPVRARADGAFPDSISIFAPANQADRVLLATNFGLLVTDDGASWRWVCEQAIAPLAFLYQLGPSGRIFALNVDSITASDDLCTWRQASFGAGTRTLADLFADPSDPMHLLAIGRLTMTSTPTNHLYESRDGGASFQVLYEAPAGARLESVEIARSNPQRVYLVMTRGRPAQRFLLRSNDGGAHWDTIDETAALGGRLPLIVQVDPDAPDRIYFRVIRSNTLEGDALGISDDGGSTVRLVLRLDSSSGSVPSTGMPPTGMSSFLRRSDGTTLIVGTLGGGFISHDSGTTFTAWKNSPKLRALAERGGVIYAAADNFADGFAVGRTRDEGTTWEPLVRFDQIQGPLSCAPIQRACDCDPSMSDCNSPWSQLKMLFGIGAADAGVPADAGPAKPSSGCKCTADARGRWVDRGGGWAVGALALLLALRARRVAPRGANR